MAPFSFNCLRTIVGILANNGPITSPAAAKVNALVLTWLFPYI